MKKVMIIAVLLITTTAFAMAQSSPLATRNMNERMATMHATEVSQGPFNRYQTADPANLHHSKRLANMKVYPAGKFHSRPVDRSSLRTPKS